MNEKREWRRIAVDVIARCRLVQEGVYHHIRITDMHHQGCCFKSLVEFEKGKEVRIVVDLPVVGSLYLAGTIQWVDHIEGDEPHCSGVRFVINDPIAIENSSKLYSYLISR